MLISTLENCEMLASEKGLERALEKQLILEAPATLCDQDFNLHVSLGGRLKGIIPRSEVQYPAKDEVKDIAILTRVGKPVCFKVMGFAHEDGKEVAILSRREAQRECASMYLADMTEGDIVPARVTHLDTFGAFVDIGCGIISLLSIDCISVSRISHPSDRLSIGDKIFTVIKSIDRENGRIFVSMRELLGTWEENASQFEVGQTVAGIVRSIESYGVFVELAPNLAGLAELREGTADESFAHIGERAAVYIKSILPEKMKIKLVLIDAYRGAVADTKLKYFIDCNTVTHIDRWRYSPEGAAKAIETVF